MEIKGKLI